MAPDRLLSMYPEITSTLASSTRQFLLEKYPDLIEEVDIPSKIIVYRIAPGMAGIVWSLILSKEGVKLGFFKGSELSDPAHLLEGTGKVHRYVPIHPAVLRDPDFQQLIETAMTHAMKRNNR